SEAPGRRPAVEIIGLADQQGRVRQAAPPHETRRARLLRERESEVWAVPTTRLGTAPDRPDIRWVRVCDRGTDSFEFLTSCAAEGHGYVVRAAQDRALVAATGAPAGRLLATARRQPSRGAFNLVLRARPGQAARTARLSVSATRVRLRAPWRPGHGRGTLPAHACTVVRVWETDPPAGAAPLEWRLWCNAEVTTLAQALERALQYAPRWLVEEFHKALKTGLGIEKLQLATGAALMAAVALLSIVALRLLHLREVVRLRPAAPAALRQLERDVLAAKTDRVLTTAQEVALALGRLGGHLNRNRDGLPGWITLWHGYVVLQSLVEGVRLAQKLKKTR
ncbi:MAG: IS4 family transposase, partial [Acidobacteria bacterium]|nr:IS4 family transposase [Acidobacteriota bacterium]